MQIWTKNRGVTLIELMVSIAIVGILAAIAIPSYQRYILKTNRPIGSQCLVEAQRRMEDVYTHLNHYPIDLTGAGYASDPFSCGDPPAPYSVTLTCPNSPSCTAATSYQLIATGQGAQAKDGTLLLTFTAGQANASTPFVKQHIPQGQTAAIAGWDFQPGQ